MSFGTMKTSSQEGDLQVKCISGALDPVSRVFGIFSNGDLSFTSVNQPRAAILLYVLGVSCKTLFHSGFLMLGVEAFVSLWLLGGSLLVQTGRFYL